MMKWLALALSVLGSLLMIAGGWILYRNTPPDLGELGGMVVPLEFRQMLDGFKENSGGEVANINYRKRLSQRGFLLIVVGSALQLSGTIVSALA